ncbi:MAG: hypothetical protein ACRYFX_30860 [Janthinobacterium lividum]
MEEQLLKKWRTAELNDVDPAVLRIIGGYIICRGTLLRHRLMLFPDQTYHLAETRDRGLRWVELLTGRYQVLGPELHLALPATRRGRTYAAYARLLAKNTSTGPALHLLPGAFDPGHPDEALTGYGLQKLLFPQLLRCISTEFGPKTFGRSLTFGRNYLALGPALKADFIEVVNDHRRVGRYPAANFRAYAR